MRIAAEGAELIAAPVAVVWARLLDHEFVASCAPGVESAEAVDATNFRVVAALGVGSVKVRFAIRVELTEVREPQLARMTVRGEAPGSMMHAESSATLSEAEDGGTRLQWAIASDVHGTLANIGARLLGATAKRLTAAFWKKFAARVAPAAGKPGRTPAKKRLGFKSRRAR